ncbi:pre-rRNA-processing protein TSR2 homolog [Spea bombifrons]|uniref:pre-rRNA-processing protein TSR2 homolog n=1 Tax=Spea bombifrons TaxID=233779 RepID=UPI00234ADA1A|nr:pre-rRNA-processing protein TSR2 homolog [Spea bombifrons]
MAACSADSRGLFGEAVRAVLGSWPVLQIAVENGFGGVHSKEKAEWMVGAVDQYFYTNADLEQYEVEETLMGMMNDEFDTIVEDGSQSLVAQQLCVLFLQCRRGDTAAVRSKIAQLHQNKYNVKVNVQEAKASDEEEESSEDETEDMDCEAAAGSTATTAPPNLETTTAHSSDPKEEEQEVDGWTVVRRKKK